MILLWASVVNIFSPKLRNDLANNDQLDIVLLCKASLDSLNENFLLKTDLCCASYSCPAFLHPQVPHNICLDG
jgi:hypothetical protein